MNMSERSFTNADTFRESRERSLNACFARVAHEHTDEVLTEREWRAYGLDVEYPEREIPDGFSWIVSVHPSSKGRTHRLIGVEFFHDGYTSGGYEAVIEDQRLAYSNTVKLERAREQLRKQIEQAEQREKLERERIAEKALELLSNVARTQQDEMLGKKEWDTYGLQAIYEPPQDFEWCVIVLPDEEAGMRRVQLQIFSAGILRDINEYATRDVTLPLSSSAWIESLNEQTHATWQAQRDREQQAQQREADEYTRERGFPPGGYTVTALFIDRRGTAQTHIIAYNDRFRVETRESKDHVRQRIENEVSMEGLHNFGLDTRHLEYPRQGAPVHVVMRNADGIEVPFDLEVNGGGHIVKRNP